MRSGIKTRQNPVSLKGFRDVLKFSRSGVLSTLSENWSSARRGIQNQAEHQRSLDCEFWTWTLISLFLFAICLIRYFQSQTRLRLVMIDFGLCLLPKTNHVQHNFSWSIRNSITQLILTTQYSFRFQSFCSHRLASSFSSFRRFVFRRFFLLISSCRLGRFAGFGSIFLVSERIESFPLFCEICQNHM